MDQIGRYKIEAQIGQGGFGRVFRAFDPNFGRHVAIKVLHAGADKDLLTRFRNEAIAVGKLQHKNIVIVHDFGQIDEMPYLVMEYLEGQDLHSTLKGDCAMDLLQKVAIMDQVAAGLHHAHRNGIVHRDVKPANIMLLRDGSVKIMDFGIARLMQDRSTRVTQHGNVIGTVQYMAPEQLKGEDVDARCDVFAFGVIYYELLTGHHPFDASDVPRILYNITMVEPPSVRSLVADCPGALESIISKTLNKDRELRYQSLEDVLFDVAPIRLDLERDVAQSLVLEAERLLKDGLTAEAQQVIRKALQYDPNNAGGRYVRESIQRQAELLALRERTTQLVAAGRRKYESGEFVQALQQFESAQRIDPNNTEIGRLISSVRAELEKAERAAALLNKARREFSARDLTGAYQHVVECLEHQPESPEAKALLSSIRTEIERRERERRFGQATARARTMIGGGEYDSALALLGDLEISYPGNDEVQQLIASAIAAKEDQQRRERVAQTLDRARKLVSESRWRDAIEVLNRVQHEHRVDSAILPLLAYCGEELHAEEKAAEVDNTIREANRLTEIHDFDGAAQRLERALIVYPGEPLLQSALRRVAATRQAHEREAAIRSATRRVAEHVAGKRFAEAIAVLDESIGAWPERELLELKDRTEQQWQEHQREEHTRAALNKAGLALEQGRTQDASAVVRKALAQYPGEVRLAELLATIDERLAREVRAKRIADVTQQAKQFAARSDYGRGLDLLRQADRELGGEPLLASAIADLGAQQIVARREEIESLRRAGRYHESLSAAEAAVREFGDTQFGDLRDAIRRQFTDHQKQEAIDAALAAADRYSRSGDLQRAINTLSEASQSHGHDAELENALADYRRRFDRQRTDALVPVVGTATRLVQDHDFDAALKLIARSLAEYPDEPTLTELMAWARSEQTAYERTRGIGIALSRAREYKEKGQLARAQEALELALRSLHDEPELTAELANIRSAIAAEEAIKGAARQAERERSERVETAVSRARALLDGGRAAEAVAVLRAALLVDPDDPQLTRLCRSAEQTEVQGRVRSATELLQASKHQEAVAALDSALRIYPDEPALLSALSNAKSELASAEREAIAKALKSAAEQASHQKQTDIETALKSAHAEQSRGAFAEALQTIGRALDRYPDDSGLTDQRKRIEAAQRNSNIEATVQQAVQEAKAGKHAPAIRRLEDAIQRDPDPRLLKALGDVRHQAEELARNSAAAAALREAEDALKRNDPDKALEIARTALSAVPEHPALRAVQSRAESAQRSKARTRDLSELQTLMAAVQRARDRAALDQIRSTAKDLAAKYAGDSEFKTAAQQIETAVRARSAELERPQVSPGGTGMAPVAPPTPVPQPTRPRRLLWLGGAAAGVLVAVALVATRSGSREGAETTQRSEQTTVNKDRVVQPPRILRLEANVTRPATGQPVQVCYGVENADSVRLEPPVEQLTPAASRCFSFTPSTGGEYKLIALGANGVETSQAFRIDMSDAPAVKPGTLAVQVAQGSTVVINGRRYQADGREGLTVPLEPGRYTVSAEKPGFMPGVPRTVRIEPDRAERIAFDLVPMKSTVAISGTPSGTTVSIDGVAVGTIQGSGTFPVQPGKHTVLLTSNGYVPKRLDVDVPRGGVLTLGAPSTAMTPAQEPPNRAAIAGKQWEQLQASRDIAALEQFRRANPGQFGDNAARRIEQVEWENARGAKTASALQSFVSKYPTSAYAGEARNILQQLEWQAVDRNSLSALRAYVNRVPDGPFTSQALAEIKRLEAGERRISEDAAAINEALKQVEAAYASKDYRRLTQVWPSAPASLRVVFKDAQSVSLNLTAVGPAQVSGDSATLTCQRSTVTTYPGKKLPPYTDRVTVRLERSAGGWRVTSVD